MHVVQLVEWCTFGKHSYICEHQPVPVNNGSKRVTDRFEQKGKV